MRKTNHSVGHFAETVAIWYLRFKGYHLVAKNFLVRKGIGAGEVDIIMTKGKTIVFFEVKKRKSFTLAAEAITIQNQMRVTKTSAIFLQKHPRYQAYQMRYDIVLFQSGHWWPKHIPNAWRIM